MYLDYSYLHLMNKNVCILDTIFLFANTNVYCRFEPTDWENV